MAKLYRDVDIVERTTITPEGRVTKTYRLSATTTSGIRFTTEVTEEDFSPEKIDKILTEKATNIEKIRAL